MFGKTGRGVAMLALGALGAGLVIAAEEAENAEEAGKAEGAAREIRPATVAEARGRAVLLHETIHMTLQVMHHDFFDPDDRDRIPSASLEDVFDELAATLGVELRWLGVNAKVMDLDHEAKDEFEKKAVAALAAGKEEFEGVEGDRYRRVGVIALHNRCLKCHVPNRTSLEDRAAGLAISMRFGKD